MSMPDNLKAISKLKNDIDFQLSTTPEFVELTLDSDQAKILRDYLNYTVVSQCAAIALDDQRFTIPGVAEETCEYVKMDIANILGCALKDKGYINFIVRDNGPTMSRKIEGHMLLPGLFTNAKEDANE